MWQRLAFLLILLSFIHFSTSLPTSFEAAIARRAAGNRLVVYVQTFHTPDNQSLCLIPLLTENTGVTHVIFSAFHINSNPGDITFNNYPPNSTKWTQAWSDAKKLQAAGVKVMGLLGGAALWTWSELSGDEASVCQLPDQLMLFPH